MTKSICDENESPWATHDWVRAYLDEAASVDLKTAKDTYDKFLRHRDLLMHDINEERKTHHATAHSMAGKNEELRLANKKLAALCEKLKIEQGHVQADSIIKFETLRTKIEILEQRVYELERQLHRQEMVKCEQEQQQRANARSADES